MRVRDESPWRRTKEFASPQESLRVHEIVPTVPAELPMPQLVVRFVCVFSICYAPFASASAADPVDYQRDIKPLLKTRCYACHGALQQKSELRVDTANSMRRGGASGPAIIAGKPRESLLIERVAARDDDQRMPPEGEPLTAAQVELLQGWIASGAVAPEGELPEASPAEHWAFQAVERPAVPAVARETWLRNPIDAFVSEQHERFELVPQAEAPRSLLIRRLYLDLIGVPPSAEELARIDADQHPDWYERLVDQLLDDPRHGERWARHWMDVWRYSDWWGLGAQLRNSQQHIWHWRDWIVESLNEDLPYDEMVRLMLAADELHPNDLNRLRASGFLARNYFLFNRHQWMDETVEHVSKGFLALTMNCAKCHDHKYDPWEQTDYYRLRAFFEPYHVRIDVVPGEADLNRDGIPRAFDGLLDEPTYLFIRGQESQPDKSNVIAPGVPALLSFKQLAIEPVPLPAEAWQPERRSWVPEAYLAAATNQFSLTEKALEKARELLASTRAAAESPTNIGLAHADLRIAERALATARAELQSLQCRIDAARVSWQVADAAAPDETLAAQLQESNAQAVRAERQVAVAKAQESLANIEKRLLQAAEDKREPIEKELQTAQAALQKAEETASKEVLNTDRHTPLIGAKWSATRFRSSGADDPAVKFQSQSTGRRSALANWITDSRNPLTARVAVNHIWARHLGTPLVATMFDFGRQGSEPTHPELLNWLATEFVENGWSMKHLHRLIVTSATYRMGSSVAGREANLAKDADNARLWRRSPIRLEGEVLRDAVLSLAGTLDTTLGGPPVPAANQADSNRRSLYFFHSNNDRNLFLTTFDAATVKECYRREQSIVPQQALAMTNSRLVLDAAERIAERVSQAAAESTEMDEAAFVRAAFQLLIGVRPSESEMAASLAALNTWRGLPEGSPQTARRQLVWVLLNHNDFVTMR